VSLPGKVLDKDFRLLNASIQAPSGLEEPCFLKRLPNGNLGINGGPKPDFEWSCVFSGLLKNVCSPQVYRSRQERSASTWFPWRKWVSTSSTHRSKSPLASEKSVTRKKSKSPERDWKRAKHTWRTCSRWTREVPVSADDDEPLWPLWRGEMRDGNRE